MGFSPGAGPRVVAPEIGARPAPRLAPSPAPAPMPATPHFPPIDIKYKYSIDMELPNLMKKQDNNTESIILLFQVVVVNTTISFFLRSRGLVALTVAKPSKMMIPLQIFV